MEDAHSELGSCRKVYCALGTTYMYIHVTIYNYKLSTRHVSAPHPSQVSEDACHCLS